MTTMTLLTCLPVLFDVRFYRIQTKFYQMLLDLYILQKPKQHQYLSNAKLITSNILTS